MSTRAKLLAVRQLDQTLAEFKKLGEVSRPPKGWLKTIRKTLGMTAKQLGNRVGISQAGVAQIENREAHGKATLSTMKKMARAVDCTFVYALVPNSTLQDFLARQAREAATKSLRTTSHSMLLESQGVADKQTELQKKILAEQILATLPSHMWNRDGY